MKPTPTESFTVDLSGLIEVLGGHLYSSPEVFVRELLQNAVDACTMRKRKQGSVELHLDTRTASLEFRDDGAGMNEETIRSSLARIGASTKRGVDRDELLGRFGIGLLAGFLVTDELIVETRQEAGPALVWVGTREGRYSLTPGTRREVGTTVRLTLREDQRTWAEPEQLRRLARKYGQYLPVAVTLVIDGEREAVSEKRPWQREPDDAKRWLSASKELTALEVVPFAHGRTKGVVWFGAGDEFASPTVDVFVKGMPVAEGMVGLLPKWAGFCGAVVDSTALLPTASREDLVRDDSFTQLGAALESKVLGWLEQAAKDQSPAFSALLDSYPAALMAACVKFHSLRAVVGRRLRFETTAGFLEWNELAKTLSGATLLTAATSRDFENARVLAASKGVLVVNLGTIYASQLVTALAADDEVRLEALTPAHLAKLVAPAPGVKKRYAAMLSLLNAAMESERIEVSLGSFNPPAMPALLLTSSDELQARALSVAASSTGFMTGFMRPFAEAEPKRVAMVLNLDNPLVQALPRVLEGESLVRVVRLLYVHAAMTLRRQLSVSETQLFCADLLGLLKTVSGLGAVN